MKFEPLPLRGAFRIVPEPMGDGRGFFARTWCRQDFERHGLEFNWVQGSMSYNRVAGVLRGLHFQRPPHQETKLIRCTAGAIFDVLVDLRPDSPTYLQWTSALLSAENRHWLYVPKGVAHGFQTLADHTEVSYQMSEYFHAESAAGVRWNDPLFAIAWPATPARVMAVRDETYPDYVR